MRHVTWFAAGTAIAMMVSAAAGQGLSAQEVEQRVRDGGAIEDDAARLKHFDALAAELRRQETAEAKPGWHIERTVSPVTDKVTLTMTLQATDEVDVGGGKKVRPVIIVRVDEVSAETSVVFGTSVISQSRDQQLRIPMRVDGYKARRYGSADVQRPADRMHIRDGMSLLQQCVCGKRLLMEFPTSQGDRVAAFDVSNSREAVQAIEEVVGQKFDVQCPRSLEEDASWYAIEEIASWASRGSMQQVGRDVLLWHGGGSFTASSDDAAWEPELSMHWPYIHAWLANNPKGRIRATSFGWTMEGAPKAASAEGLRNWLKGELEKQRFDMSRIEVVAVTPERAAELVRRPGYGLFIHLYGFELAFITDK
jgi:hypothetical protein